MTHSSYRNWLPQAVDPCDFAFLTTDALVRPGGDTSDGFAVTTFDDATCIALGDSAGPVTFLGQIDAGQVLTGTAGPGDVLWTNGGRISASGEARNGNSDIAFVPEYVAATTLATTVSRGGGVEFFFYSFGATSVTVTSDDAWTSTIAITPGSVASTTRTGGGYTGNYVATANGNVVGWKVDDGTGSTDSDVMVAPAADIIGFASNSAYVASADQSNPSTFIARSAGYGNHSNNAGSVYDVVTGGDLGGGSVAYYDARGAVRVQGQGAGVGELFFANSRADSDGGNDTIFFPVGLMRPLHAIPQPSEFVSMAALSAATVTKILPDGTTSTIILTKTNGDALAPFSFRDGTPNGGTNIPAGTRYLSNAPMYVVYQPKGAGTSGADDDETVSFGVT